MPVPEIGVDELKKKFDRKDKFVLLDVREQDEYDTARIEGSTLIPMGTIPQRLADIPKDQEVVVHCHHGGRSARVAAFLIQNGYKAFNLAGGINAWSERIDASVPTY